MSFNREIVKRVLVPYYKIPNPNVVVTVSYDTGHGNPALRCLDCNKLIYDEALFSVEMAMATALRHRKDWHQDNEAIWYPSTA